MVSAALTALLLSNKTATEDTEMNEWDYVSHNILFISLGNFNYLIFKFQEMLIS